MVLLISLKIYLNVTGDIGQAVIGGFAPPMIPVSIGVRL